MQASARLAAFMLTIAPSAAGAPQVGTGRQTAVLDGTPIEVFTFRPTGCQPTALLLVFHGLNRNASEYRDDVIPLAERNCMLVVAPLFDRERFPTWRYQRGGIVHDEAVQPPERWTVRYVPLLADWARRQEGQPDLPYDLVGHSAGAQFLSRVVAFGAVSARHIILANPSTWVQPSLTVAAPYGFGGAYPAPQAQAALKRSLAEPVTVLLGAEDVGSKNLVANEQAEGQGPTRLARGENEFRDARQTAQQHGWTFNWRLSVVTGVGHSARQMLTSDQAFAALVR